MIHIKAPRFLKYAGFILTGTKTANGLCLFNLLIYKDKLTPELINHETIHWQQYKELFILGFIILYYYYHFTVGYWNNPLEKEAYANDHNLNYLKTRKPYSWKHYS